MAKSPEENARASVEKALKAREKAQEKYDALKAKFEEAEAALHRADREVVWTASHPDLPLDFDLQAFQDEVAAPFGGDEPESVAAGGVSEPVREELGDKEFERQKKIQADDDDPFGDAG